MNKPLMLLLVFAAAGCLGPAPKPPVTWTIDFSTDEKVASAMICAPFAGERLAVLRADGSIAFDPCNAFAASPLSIIRDASVGRRGEGALIVRKLALDCRSAGRRDAVVELEIVRDAVVARGAATEPTADGNYTAAFSRAFTAAFTQARERMKVAQ